MSITRILIITLLVSTGLVIYGLFSAEPDSSDEETSREKPTTPVSSNPVSPSSTPLTPPVSTVMPAEGSTAPAAVGNEQPPASEPEQSEEDLEKEQVAAAIAQLNSTKNEERIEAVEQLGAYPSPETETILANLLATESNPELRNAAALSLGSLDTPTAATINVLMAALEDQNEDVRFSALSTLEDFLLGQEEDTSGYRQIRDGLKAKLAVRGLPADIHDSITEVLRDQQSQPAP